MNHLLNEIRLEILDFPHPILPSNEIFTIKHEQRKQEARATLVRVVLGTVPHDIISRASILGMRPAQSHRALFLEGPHPWFNALLLTFSIGPQKLCN